MNPALRNLARTQVTQFILAGNLSALDDWTIFACSTPACGSCKEAKRLCFRMMEGDAVFLPLSEDVGTESAEDHLEGGVSTPEDV